MEPVTSVEPTAVIPTTSATTAATTTTNSLDDLDMPRSVVARLIKQMLPDTVSLKPDARTAIIKASHDISVASGSKTLTAQNILKALQILEFNPIIPGVEAGLQTHKDLLKNKKAASKRKANDAKDAQALKGADDKKPRLEEEVEDKGEGDEEADMPVDDKPEDAIMDEGNEKLAN